MSDPVKVLIAGAGIAGLVAALAMIARGMDVTIYEQAPELKELGAGVQLSANGTRVLIGLGLGPQMEAIATTPVAKQIRLWNTGQSWNAFDLGTTSVARFGAPYWLVHRGDFHRILVEAVRRVAPGCIVTGARCLDFEQDDDGVTLQIEGGRSARGDILVAGDGVHSVVRGGLYGNTKASFLGIAAWRGLVPFSRLPPHMQQLVGCNWVGPGGHIVTYPVHEGELLNFVGAIERENWPVESWTEAGTHEECLADFVGWHEDIQTIVRNMDVPYKWALLGRDPLPSYVRERVVLMGDAAHPTLPFMAQGANMAIEDGVVLARCLEDDEDVVGALQRYDAARLERTTRIVQAANENAKRFHNPAMADPVLAAAYVDREWSPEKVSSRYDWVFEYDPWTVAI